MTALVGGGIAFLPGASAQAAVVNATLVKTTWTGGSQSNWTHPSPDPSGITYNSSTGRLIISDGEVDETNLSWHVYKGTNLYVASLQGQLLETGANTLAYSAEPVGVGFRPTLSADFPERLFVSDDDKDRVFEVDRGTDGRYGTADDRQTSFSTRFVGSQDDAEDVAVDLELTRNGQLLIIDGFHKEVYVYGPGPNKRFDGVDDTRSQFDVAIHGAGDPEGIAFNRFRNTLFVLDDPSNQLYEFNLQGQLQNIVKLPFTMKSGAGIALAPPSNGSGGAPNAYIVDRGVDNDSSSTLFNDGRLYEVAIPGLTGTVSTNQPPVVSAGPDKSTAVGTAVALAGSVTDDGTAAPTASWARVPGTAGGTGAGTVTFANAASPSTTATFTASGTYVLRLTGSDGTSSVSDDMTVTVTETTTTPPPTGSGVLDIPVRAGSDDAEQVSGSSADLTSSDLELVTDGTVQTVGLRFTGVGVPAGSTITNAYVQFQVDEATTATANLTVAGEAADNAATFTTAVGSVTNRPRTSASAAWAPTAWSTVGARTTAQRTPDLSAVVQAIVNRPGWAGNNAMVLLFTGTGTRTAEAFESGTASAPVLHIEYGSGSGGGGTTNAAPVVSAGPDKSTAVGTAVALAGSVTDDGTAAPTASWARVAGADGGTGTGTVTFANAASASTTATFSAAGTYVLRLTGSDGTSSVSDDMTVTVTEATTTPSTGSGVLDIPVRASTDDAEQRSASVVTSSGDLNLVTDGSTVQTVGMRFTGVSVPKGATITNAYVQFQVDEVSTAATSLTIAGEASGDAATFAAVAGNISGRARTSATAAWAPVVEWSTANARTADQRTSNLASVVQEIVNRGDWATGNPVALIVTGSGARVAESYDGGAAKAPVLHIEYRTS